MELFSAPKKETMFTEKSTVTGHNHTKLIKSVSGQTCFLSSRFFIDTSNHVFINGIEVLAKQLHRRIKGTNRREQGVSGKGVWRKKCSI